MSKFTLKSAVEKLSSSQFVDLIGYDLEDDEAFIFIKKLANNPESCNTCKFAEICEIAKHVKAQTDMSLQEMRFNCFTPKDNE